MELTFIAAIFWSLFFMVVVPWVLFVWIGYGVSQLAQRLALRQQSAEYPTAQMLELTFDEQPEQWPPLPTIGLSDDANENECQGD